MSEEYIPKIAMSIQAHPDDQEFGIGGTIAKWTKAGCEFITVVITSGLKSGDEVIMEGARGLSDGQRIEISNTKTQQ